MTARVGIGGAGNGGATVRKTTAGSGKWTGRGTTGRELLKAPHYHRSTPGCSAMAASLLRASSVAPLGKLVRPGGVKLRAAQALGVFGGKRLRHRAVRPFKAPARGNPDRPLIPPMRGHEPRHAFDHHLAHLMLALADERD